MFEFLKIRDWRGDVPQTPEGGRTCKAKFPDAEVQASAMATWKALYSLRSGRRRGGVWCPERWKTCR